MSLRQNSAAMDPLVRELRQGRKMCSLEALMAKLDEDQNRHVIHSSHVEEGLGRLRCAQGLPLQAAEAARTGVYTYPNRLRSEVESARGDVPAIMQDLAAEAAAEAAQSTPSVVPPSEPRADDQVTSPSLRHRVYQPAPDVTKAASEGNMPTRPISAPTSPPQAKEVVSLSTGTDGSRAGVDRTARAWEDQSNTVYMRSNDRAFSVKIGQVDMQSIQRLHRGTKRKTLLDNIDDSELQKRINDSPPTICLVDAIENERAEAKLVHDDEVMSIACSPDGGRLVAGGEDRKVTVWCLDEKRPLFSVACTSSVSAVVYCPSSLYFAAGESEGVVTLWSGSDLPEEVATTEVESTVMSMAMVHWPSKLLAAGSSAKKVFLLSVPSLDQIAELHHDGEVRSLSFSPSGKMLAGGGGTDHGHGLLKKKAADAETKAVIWRVADTAKKCQYMGSVSFEDIVHAVAYSPSGKLLAVGGEYNYVAMLLVEKVYEKTAELQVCAGVRCLAWSPDSCFLATGGEDMQITVWNVLTESIAFQLPKATDWYCGVTFTANMRWVAFCGYGQHDVGLRAIQAENIGGATAEALKLAAPREVKVVDMDGEGFIINMDQALATGEKKLDLFTRVHQRPSVASLLLGITPLPLQMVHQQEKRDSVMLGHKDEVIALVFSPDGKYVLSGGEDCVASLWDFASATRIWSTQLNGALTAVGYSSTGKYFTIGDADSFIGVWTTEGLGEGSLPEECGNTCVDGLLSLAMGATSKGFEMVAVGISSHRDASQEANNATAAVHLFSLPHMTEIATLNFGGDVRSLSFSPNATRLVGGGGIDDHHGLISKKNASVRGLKTVVWQVSEISDECKYLGSMLFPDIVHVVAFAPSGKLLAVGAENSFIYLMLVDRGFEKTSEYMSPAGVRTLSWSPDGRFIASAGEDMQVSVWDVVSERIAFQLPKAIDWYQDVMFSPCGEWLATCSYQDCNVMVYPVATVTKHPDGRPPALAITEEEDEEEVEILVEQDNGEAILSVSPMCSREQIREERHSVTCLMMGLQMSGIQVKPKEEEPLKLSHKDEVLALKFTPDGKHLLAGGEDKRLVLWNVSRSTESFGVQMSDAITAVACSPSGSYFACACEDNVTVFSMGKQEEIGQAFLEGQVLSLTMGSRPAEIIAVGSSTGLVTMLSVPNLLELKTVQLEGDVRSLAFSRDCSRLAAGGGKDETHGLISMKGSPGSLGMLVTVWQIKAEGVQATTLNSVPFSDIVHAVAFSPNGRLVACGGEDCKITLLLADRRFNKGPTYPLVAGCRSLAFSLDSRFLATGGEDCMISVWDLSTENLAFQLPKASDWILSLDFGPFGDVIASCGYQDKAVTLTRLETVAWIQQEKQPLDSAIHEDKVFMEAIEAEDDEEDKEEEENEDD